MKGVVGSSVDFAGRRREKRKCVIKKQRLHKKRLAFKIKGNLVMLRSHAISFHDNEGSINCEMALAVPCCEESVKIVIEKLHQS